MTPHRVLPLVWLLCGWVLFSGTPVRGAEQATPAARDLRVGKLSIGKVLFLGNSITLHGPAPTIGWNGNWGIAASAEDKDYVHLLVHRLAQAAGGTPEFMVKNIADFERQHDTYDLDAGLQKEFEFQADLVVLAIGENVPALTTAEAQAKYQAAYAKLLAELAEHGKPAVFVRSCFWAEPAKDGMMKQAAEEAGATFVDVGSLGRDQACLSRDQGVAGHPNDKGMQAIADALWKAIETKAADD